MTAEVHEHVDGRCGWCFRAGNEKGYRSGHSSGFEEGYHDGVDSCPDPDYVRAAQADELREVAERAHRRAGHDGRFELCREAMCAAIEDWLYHESRPAGREPREAVMGRMVAG